MPRDSSLRVGFSGVSFDRPRVSATLLAVAVTAIGFLTYATIADLEPAIVMPAQGLLLLSFATLAILDFRLAVAVALIEMTCGGASGRWTEFAGFISGRMALDAIVLARAIATLVALFPTHRGRVLGRYGLHALALALILPVVWFAIGAANGHELRDVIGDGNGTAFYAFALVFIVLAQLRQGGWLRSCFFVACAANAVLTGALIAVTADGLVDLRPTMDRILTQQLDMGGVVGIMPNGAYRLFLGSALYLQVGVVLTAWRLLVTPRVWWLWALFTLLWIDILATYTRGIWLGSLVGLLLVLAFGASRWRRSLAVMVGTASVFVVLATAGALVDFSLPDYVLTRSATLAPQELSSIPEASPDIAGRESNALRIEQARVLWGHIVDRPIVGFGFGAIAEDYRYGDSYSYELSYLDLLFKTGFLGFVLFLSFHARMLFDGLRGRLGRLRVGPDVSRYECATVIAIVVSVMLTAGTNPFLLAAFGLLPVLICVAWLQPPIELLPKAPPDRADVSPR